VSRPYARTIPQGLSVDAHRALGARLRAVRAELQAVRRVVSAACSSASKEYASCSRLLKELTTLETVLRLAAVGQHVDQRPLGELQRLYGDDPLSSEDHV
jgi:hypothetical protein